MSMNDTLSTPVARSTRSRRNKQKYTLGSEAKPTGRRNGKEGGKKAGNQGKNVVQTNVTRDPVHSEDPRNSGAILEQYGQVVNNSTSKPGEVSTLPAMNQQGILGGTVVAVSDHCMGTPVTSITSTQPTMTVLPPVIPTPTINSASLHSGQTAGMQVNRSTMDYYCMFTGQSPQMYRSHAGVPRGPEQQQQYNQPLFQPTSTLGQQNAAVSTQFMPPSEAGNPVTLTEAINRMHDG